MGKEFRKKIRALDKQMNLIKREADKKTELILKRKYL